MMRTPKHPGSFSETERIFHELVECERNYAAERNRLYGEINAMDIARNDLRVKLYRQYGGMADDEEFSEGFYRPLPKRNRRQRLWSWIIGGSEF